MPKLSSKTNVASEVTLKSVLCLPVKPAGIICHDVETSRQHALGLEFGGVRGKDSVAQAGEMLLLINAHSS